VIEGQVAVYWIRTNVRILPSSSQNHGEPFDSSTSFRAAASGRTCAIHPF
jgi:hypothetical protein